MFYACAFAQAGLALAATRLALDTRGALPLVVAGAVALRLAFLPTVPNLSGDVYRYIWDGRVVAAGFNPYSHVPADPVLIPLRDPAQYGLIDKRDYAVTIYPPVAEALFALVTRLSSSVLAMKAAMVLLEGVAALATARLLRRLGRRPERLALYLLHPAPVWEIAGNGHVDAAMMACLFGAFAWGEAGHPVRPAIVAALGSLVKPTAALALPALWRPWQVRLPLLVLGVAALCYAPFLSAGTGIVGFLPNYAHEQGLDTGAGVFALAVAPGGGARPPLDGGRLRGRRRGGAPRPRAVDAAARRRVPARRARRHRPADHGGAGAVDAGVSMVLPRRPPLRADARPVEPLRAVDGGLPALRLQRGRSGLPRPVVHPDGVRAGRGGARRVVLARRGCHP